MKREPQGPGQELGLRQLLPALPRKVAGDRSGFSTLQAAEQAGGTHTWEKAWLLQRGLSFLE